MRVYIPLRHSPVRRAIPLVRTPFGQGVRRSSRFNGDQESLKDRPSVIAAVVDMEVEGMKVTLGTSTGAEIEVWREMDLFHVRRVDRGGEAQICWGIDLFEVIAELAQLDLHDRAQAAEAIRLAAEAERRLPDR